ncbi:MAG: hypothetical protein IKD27_05645 [Oscillospiraceae bacterium]|nr:hypothetical protein [Oscillospiraceae bacterium]
MNKRFILPVLILLLAFSCAACRAGQDPTTGATVPVTDPVEGTVQTLPAESVTAQSESTNPTETEPSEPVPTETELDWSIGGEDWGDGETESVQPTEQEPADTEPNETAPAETDEPSWEIGEEDF